VTDASRVRGLVLLLGLSYAVSFVDRALVAVAGAPIKAEFGLSDTAFGALQGLAFAAMYCLCGIPFGWLADRARRTRMLAVGLASWSLMTAACGLAGSFAVFFVARIGVGIGEACLVPVAMSLMGSAVSTADQPKAIAIFLMGATLGNSAAFIGGGHLLTALSASGASLATHVGPLAPWRVLFILAAIPGLLMAALVAALPEPARRSATALPNDGRVHDAIAHVRANARAYAMLTAATACSVTLAQAQAAWIPLLYMRRFGLAAGDSASTVGWIFLLTAPTGQWLGGRLLHRMHARRIAAPSAKLLAGTALLSIPAAAVFCTSESAAVSWCAYAVFNFVVFAATPAGLTGWQLMTPERVRGFVIAALVSVVTLAGVGIGPWVVGLVTDRWFHDPAALNLSLLTVICVAAAGCALFAWFGRKSLARAIDAA
jgi:MFS family permease